MVLADADRVVLITGASTGIGLALVRALERTGFRVVATARAESLGRFLQAGITPNERRMIVPLDVRRPEERQAALAMVRAQWGAVDVLINNAAIAYRAVCEHMGEEDDLEQLRTNYLAPLELARLVLPEMRARRRGHIINISSVAGMMAMPTMGPYSASKFALEGATEALWYEARPWRVRVCLVEPGFVHSESFRNARFTSRSRQALEDPSDPYHRYYSSMLPFIERMMRWSWATPEHVARRILRLMRDPDPPLRVQATVDARLFALLRRLLPARLYHRVLYAALPGVRRWVRSSSTLTPAPRA
ncbi:MAG: SDR family oxidoreductase [Bacteroidetes bacterium]|nr:SDR family oxidoreductase [Rhodothermia bacterium]MCS7154931.1 SDR family oxidoreductase [Bacteroidota bacterium]MCX7906910.1 SDR family oxidoreductase [Bacteroidota bacterium]MDW8137726.1 SDR family oxidoreductase [Bacteroidota bacterium]MDW8285320.1 SDR family oxidoreductase [Bacteroidota bacterium]